MFGVLFNNHEKKIKELEIIQENRKLANKLRMAKEETTTLELHIKELQQENQDLYERLNVLKDEWNLLYTEYKEYRESNELKETKTQKYIDNIQVNEENLSSNVNKLKKHIEGI